MSKDIKIEEEAIKLYEALQRLEKNEDWQYVIREKYLRDSVLDNFSLLAHPSIKRNGERPEVMEELVSKSHLNLFLLTIEQQGEHLLNDTKDSEDVPELDEE